MLGLTALSYGLAHLCLYVMDQNFNFWVVVSESVRRLYLTIGLAALVGASVLGLTSTDGWMRKLGRNWKRLHQAIFGVIAFASLHSFMWSKVVTFQAVLLAGFFLWLVFWRALPAKWQDNAGALLVLAPIAATATALIDFAWWSVVPTHIPATRVLLANIHGLRPAVWVGIVSVGAAMPTVVRKVAVRAQSYRQAHVRQPDEAPT
jgi:sulfoxide reductase heme-binding subunit YedZ